MARLVCFPPFRLGEFVRLGHDQVATSQFHVGLSFKYGAAKFAFQRRRANLVIGPSDFVEGRGAPTARPSFALLSYLVVRDFRVGDVDDPR